RLKPQTTLVIHQLLNASIRPVMVTGDNILTALSVARDCDMIGDRDAVILVQATPAQPPFQAQLDFHYAGDLQRKVHEVVPEHAYSLPNTRDPEIDIKEGNYHLAMTGRSWEIVRNHFPHLIPKLVVKGTVFARFSPDQKAQLVESLQQVGYTVGMCGDGANDCGALKAAHAGISLSEAEASVASPFTSKEQNISCVPTLIREGRCAIVTSFGTFNSWLAILSRSSCPASSCTTSVPTSLMDSFSTSTCSSSLLSASRLATPRPIRNCQRRRQVCV
ncbi:hypothetical protein BOX15_Mlig034017g2, partial [Macrostomum lignano]